MINYIIFILLLLYYKIIIIRIISGSINRYLLPKFNYQYILNLSTSKLFSPPAAYDFIVMWAVPEIVQKLSHQKSHLYNRFNLLKWPYHNSPPHPNNPSTGEGAEGQAVKHCIHT